MTPDAAARLLVFNAGVQILFSSILGVLLLVPMQPWGRGLNRFVRNPREVVLAHVDWYMLAFMQAMAALGFWLMPTPEVTWVAWLLIAGGWLNPLPYLLRGISMIDAFVLAPPIGRMIWAGIAGGSVICILVAWGVLLPAWWPQL